MKLAKMFSTPITAIPETVSDTEFNRVVSEFDADIRSNRFDGFIGRAERALELSQQMPGTCCLLYIEHGETPFKITKRKQGGLTARQRGMADAKGLSWSEALQRRVLGEDPDGLIGLDPPLTLRALEEDGPLLQKFYKEMLEAGLLTTNDGTKWKDCYGLSSELRRAVETALLLDMTFEECPELNERIMLPQQGYTMDEIAVKEPRTHSQILADEPLDDERIEPIECFRYRAHDIAKRTVLDSLNNNLGPNRFISAVAHQTTIQTTVREIHPQREQLQEWDIPIKLFSLTPILLRVVPMSPEEIVRNRERPVWPAMERTYSGPLNSHTGVNQGGNFAQWEARYPFMKLTGYAWDTGYTKHLNR